MRTRCIFPIHFCDTRALKKSKSKIRKSDQILFQDSKKTYAYFQTLLIQAQFQKDQLKLTEELRGQGALPIHFCSIKALKKSEIKMQKKG